MGIFNRKKETRSTELATYVEAPYFANESDALGSPSLWACVQLLSGTIASLPFKLYDRQKSRVKDHPVARALSLQANPAMDAFTFKQKLVVDLLLDGNSYVYPLDTKGVTTGFVPLNTNKVKIGFDSGRKVYTLPSGRVIDNLIHVMGMSKDGVKGISVVSYHAESLNVAFSLRRFFFNFFKRGLVPSGVLKTDKVLSKEAFERLKQGFSASFGGVENSHKLLILEEGMSFAPVTMNAKDADLIESKNLSDLEICRITGVPPSLVGFTDKATFGSVEAQNSSFLTYTLMPWLKRIETAFNAAHFPLGDYYLEFDTNAFLRPTTKERFEAYGIAIDKGLLSPNECRSFEGLPPSEQEGANQLYLMTNNLSPIATIVEGESNA